MTAKSLNEQLFEACETGNAPEVDVLLDRGAELEAKNSDGNSVLSLAVVNQKTKIILSLLHRGADPNTKDLQGYSPLCLAAMFANSQICLVLLDHGADLEDKDNDGIAPLSPAQRQDIEQPALWLLEHGIELKHKKREGCSPLVLAAWRSKMENCRVLLERGADTESKASNGCTALGLAASLGDIETSVVLMAFGATIPAALDSPEAVKFNESILQCLAHPLHSAATLGMTRECVQLLDLGHDIDQKDMHGKTPIECAGVVSHEETQAAMRSWLSRQETRRTMSDIAKSSP